MNTDTCDKTCAEDASGIDPVSGWKYHQAALIEGRCKACLETLEAGARFHPEAALEPVKPARALI